jgi:hypothetical protein
MTTPDAGRLQAAADNRRRQCGTSMAHAGPDANNFKKPRTDWQVSWETRAQARSSRTGLPACKAAP